MNVVCRGRFSPSIDNKYRIKDDNEEINANARLPPKSVPKSSTQQSPKVASNSSLDTQNLKSKIPQALNKKDLSTISERSERSSTTLEVRDAALNNRIHRREAIPENFNLEHDHSRVFVQQNQNIVPKLGKYLDLVFKKK